MKRIQRKRTKGFKLPPNTLVITRPTKWSNPYKVLNESDRDRVVILFREWVNLPENTLLRTQFLIECDTRKIKNLACFCSPDSVCHGDVWLEVWNEYQKQIGNSDGN